MILNVLSSSSAGNCYILGNDKEKLIIECGVKINSIKKELNFDFTGVVGCIITHEHGDHATSCNDLIKYGVNCYSSVGTFHALNIKSNRAKCISHLKKYKVGNFTILPFNVVHDAIEPFGYIISHKEIGNMLFLTDTSDLDYTFKNLNHVLIECNHRFSDLQNNVFSGKTAEFLAKRIIDSHMGIDKTKEVLSSLDLINVYNVVLIHLSAQNSNGNEFKTEIANHTNKNTEVAVRGLKLDIKNSIF